MPENIGAQDAAFNTLIPSIDENADIQTAFRLYHYGQGSSGLGDLNPNSVAGFLQALTDQKIDAAPTVIPLNSNLNDYTTSGFYVQDSNTKANTGTNYPIIPPTIGRPYAGFLRVINDGTNTYQEYQVAGIPNGKTYWRSFFGNLGWSDWRTFAEEGHEHPQYFEKEEARQEFEPQIKYLTIRQPTIVNNEYTLGNLDVNALVMIDNGSLPNTVYIPNNSSVPFVVGTQITVLQKNLGQTTIAGNSGVRVRFTPSNRLRAVYSAASLIKIATNEWVVVGDLA